MHMLTSIFYSFCPHTASLWNNLSYDVVSTVPLVPINIIFWMYASISLELFMHPLLVLFTWLEKKEAVSGGEFRVVPGGERGEGIEYPVNFKGDLCGE